MTKSSPARVFISYSRKDGRAAATKLRNQLLKKGLSVWQDLIALEGGRDWWTQIEDTIRSPWLQHLVLIVTPESLASPIVRREIRLARQEGKTVLPVRGPGIKSLDDLARWLGHVYDLSFSDHRTAFLGVLRQQSTQHRVPMMAPEPPADFVQRVGEFSALKQMLLDAKGDAIAITAALKGAGGYGKTTLARALAHDSDIYDAYFDGVLWAELGESPHNILSVVSDLIARVTGAPAFFETINAAGAALGEALGSRRILLVIDDVWRDQDLRPFMRGAPNSTRLITTRNDHVLSEDVMRLSVDAMRKEEAVSLLSNGFEGHNAPRFRREFSALASRLGSWAQLLKIINSFLHNRVTRAHEPLGQALAAVDERLSTSGLRTFDARSDADRTKTIAYTIEVSLTLLDADGRARFGELAIFPEDADIPIGIIARLWRLTAHLDVHATEDLLSELGGLSLLQNLDFTSRTARLHDNIRRFLRERVGHAGLVIRNKHLVSALEHIDQDTSLDRVTLQYYFRYYPMHLVAANARTALDKLLLSPEWIAAKLQALEDAQALAADYEQYGRGTGQALIGEVLRLVGGIVHRDPKQVLPQLLGRLMNKRGLGLNRFLKRARNQVSTPAVLMLRPSLTPPGAEIMRFEGHTGWVNSVCALEGELVASCGSDRTIRLWNIRTGAQLALWTFEYPPLTLCALTDGKVAAGLSDGTIVLLDVAKHTRITRSKRQSGNIKALCRLPDGGLASASGDDTVAVWEVTKTLKLRALFKDLPANGLCLSANGLLVSGLADGTIQRWDRRARTVKTVSGERFAEWGLLDGNYSRSIESACLLPDGRIACGDLGGEIWIWDLAGGIEPRCLKGHGDAVETLDILKDGRLISGSRDGSIRAWHYGRGTQELSLRGHTGSVTSVCVLADGKLLSAGSDGSIRLWDIKRSPKLSVSKGNIEDVRALCHLSSRRVALGANDGTISLHDISRKQHVASLKGHAESINALCLLPEGQLASASFDQTVRIWDLSSHTQIGCLKGHSRSVNALCILPNGGLASGAGDSTIRLWNLASRTEVGRLELGTYYVNRLNPANSNWVHALFVMPDGYLYSISSDHTLRKWDTFTGLEMTRMRLTPTERPTRADFPEDSAWCVLPNGLLALGYVGGAIRLWDLAKGQQEACLLGHSEFVQSICALSRNRLLSSSYEDRTVRLWDLEVGAEMCRLEFDAPVRHLSLSSPGRILGVDAIGRLHWLSVVDRKMRSANRS